MDFSSILDALYEKLHGWLEALILILPNLVVATLVVLLSAVLARVGSNLVHRILNHVSSVRQVNKLLTTVTYVAILAVGVFIALGILELDGTVTSLLAGAGIIGLALGFAFQDIASNFIAGILLAIRHPFRAGDIVETNDYFGTVDHIDLRATILRTFEGQLVIIPNKEVFQNPLTNFTVDGSRRVDIACGVSYGDDLERAKDVALAAVTSLGIHLADRPVDLYYEEFGDSSINFSLRFWIEFHQQTDYLSARSQAVIAIKNAFDTAGITIPFPIRTLDFGIVGGEKLSDVLPASLYGGGY